MLLSLLSAFAPRIALSQFTECPFPDESAVADTLDPQGYFPLAPGNAWEYVRWSDCCLDRVSRREVIGDTLIDGETLHVLKVTDVYYEGNSGDPLEESSVRRRDARREYLTLREGVLMTWGAADELVAGRDLSLPFQSCHLDQSTGSQTVVWAMPAAPYKLNEGAGKDTFTPPAGKALDVDGEQILYQYGIGYVSGGAGDSVEVLTYGAIDGLTFGQPLSEIFGVFHEVPEAQPVVDFGLENYPNPFSTETHFEFALARSGSATIRIVDILGRTVAVPLERSPLTGGTHRITWRAGSLASGVYFALLFHDGKLVETRSIVLAR